MVGRRPTLPHAELAAFIRNNNAVAASARLARLQQEEPAYQALFELIALCQAQTHSQRLAHAAGYPQTFFDLEELLSRVYARAATPEEAGQILNGLLASPSFYQRMLAKLEILSPQSAWTEAEAVEGLVVKSDAEIFEIVRRSRPEPAEEFDTRKLAVFVFLLTAAITRGVRLIVHKPAYAFAVPLAVLAAFMFLFRGSGEDDLGRLYTFDDNLPYDLESDEVRGPSGSASEDSLLYHDFKGRLQLAQSYYVTYDYQQTVEVFEQMRTQAEALHSEPEKYSSLLRDYYFYAGVSSFAWSRSKRSEQSEEERKRRAEQAIHWLARADSIAQTPNMAERERETFFLALAEGFAGRKREAETRLRGRIQQSSVYFEKSSRLIKEWSKP